MRILKAISDICIRIGQARANKELTAMGRYYNIGKL